ncbi:MAG: MBOAT family protein [Lachnospiraceae bacterium]|nr:MBOAT family protein [Lachnospiraceae bacterium]
MNFVTAEFFIFLTLLFILYYLPPLRRIQWVVLLCGSIIFYLRTGIPFFVFIAGAAVLTWGGALLLEWTHKAEKDAKAALDTSDKAAKKALKAKYARRVSLILVPFLFVLFGVLVFMKYYNFAVKEFNALMNILRPGTAPVSFLYMVLPLGISFYTFQAAGYLIDVARGTVHAEKNFFKILLFLTFFPQIVQGPISPFDRLFPQLVSEHRFDFSHFKSGAELMLWGYFKKIVIAERLFPVVNTVPADFPSYSGSAGLFALLSYALYLYADFSGGIDIIRGIAEISGIDMVENFRRPYFSETLTEYWNRWHMSLGQWMKTYVFYPLAVSSSFDRIRKGIGKTRFGKSAYGKHVANVFPGCLSTFIVFILIGLWHGAELRYLAFGLFNGTVLALSMLFAPAFLGLNRLLHIKTGSFPFKLFRIFRTFLLVLAGYVFDIAPSVSGAFGMVKKMFCDQNPSFFFEEELFPLFQVSEEQFALDITILIISAIFLFAVSLWQEKRNTPVRSWLNTRPYVLQFVLLLFFTLFVLTYGIYGPDYDVQGFVYMNF